MWQPSAVSCAPARGGGRTAASYLSGNRPPRVSSVERLISGKETTPKLKGPGLKVQTRRGGRFRDNSSLAHAVVGESRRGPEGAADAERGAADALATGTSYACMLSPQSSFRLGWDIFIAVVLAYVAIVEPLALGFSGFRHLTRHPWFEADFEQR